MLTAPMRPNGEIPPEIGYSHLAQDTPRDIDDTTLREGSKDFGSERDAEPTDQVSKMLELVRRAVDVRSDRFAMAVGVVILVNAVTIGLETDLGMEKFRVVEWVFLIVYMTEMVLRINQLRRNYLKDPWNIFDASLVCLSVIDMIIIPLVSAGGESDSMSILRLVRAARILRITRLFRMFAMLSVILQAFVKAISVVAWVGVLTLIIDYICAVVLTQAVGKSAKLWGDDADKVEQWFGTIPQSMQSLFVIMTLSEWDEMAHVMAKVLPPYVVWPAFISYILVVAYSMTSLITGVISESLLTARSEEETLRLQELEENRRVQLKGLHKALAALDEDESGTLTHDEVARALETHHEIVPRLQALDVNIEEEDLVKLFDKMARAGGGRKITIDDFVDFLRCHSGAAKAAALFDAKHDLIHSVKESESRRTKEMNDLRQDVKQLWRCMDQIQGKVGILVRNAGADPKSYGMTFSAAHGNSAAQPAGLPTWDKNRSRSPQLPVSEMTAPARLEGPENPDATPKSEGISSKAGSPALRSRSWKSESDWVQRQQSNTGW
eukprot:gnl/TRDRNA2_/TRDRNA2_176168_c0_seq4.p1 gnl/TRDRNA2_/TRDRNA2_176168_c0~~gnl/TRDRNA2_/TRDRNA2_176168_c0_seq4.p1  ORF type:complete len:552 (-),score=75.36 gnl/TRDRNA2_/TRDRNA2_176168_c0_seq4:169-1824(-)